MNITFRFGKIFLSLLTLISLLIFLPAYIEQKLHSWQIIFLATSYLLFFIPTVWRTTKFGNLAKRSEDRQVKSISGRIASLVGILGLVAVHWLAIYEYSHIVTKANTLNNLLFSTIGISLIVSGILVNQIAVKTLGKFFDRLTIKNEHQLVTSGIYSKVRHPIYTSYLLLFVGFCTLLQSWLSLAALILVCLVWFGNRISIEENMLIEEFGENYNTYKQQTNRLIPLVY